MRSHRQVARDDAWRRGLIDRLEAIEASKVEAARGTVPPPRVATRPSWPTLPALGAPPLPASAIRRSAPAAEPALSIEELRRSLERALAGEPTASPLDVEAALTALTSELVRMARPARVPQMPAPAPMIAYPRAEPAAASPFVLPKAVTAARMDRGGDAVADARRAPAGLLAAAAGTLLVAAGVLGYQLATQWLDGSGSPHAIAAQTAAPGRFESHFRLPEGPPPEDAIAPDPQPGYAPAVLAHAEASEGAAPAEEPAQPINLAQAGAAVEAPPLPIPKAPIAAPTERPAKARAATPPKRVVEPAPRKAPAVAAKAPAHAPTRIATSSAPLRPVPRAPRPAGALTLGGPAPQALPSAVSVGAPSNEYRPNVPAGPPAWLPRPDH